MASEKDDILRSLFAELRFEVGRKWLEATMGVSIPAASSSLTCTPAAAIPKPTPAPTPISVAQSPTPRPSERSEKKDNTDQERACVDKKGTWCNWQCYLDRYKDLQKEFGATDTKTAAKHYKDKGGKEGRDCTCSAEVKAKPNSDGECITKKK